MTTEQNIDRAVTIVSAYVSANAIPRADLPGLITEVYGALQSLTAPVVEEAPAAPLSPAVPVRKSVHPDFIICLEDGKKFKSLKRHLRGLGMTPDEYRAKWGLPADYPMVAPSYSATRSKLAKDNGLGRKADWQAAA
jgi:predicted transcriptional regulator